MYSVLLDKSGYFTGSYSKLTPIVGGVWVEELPLDGSKSHCYQYREIITEELVEFPKVDSENNPILDEDSNPLMEQIKVPHSSWGWTFDQSRYDAEQRELELEKIRTLRTEAFKISDKYQLTLYYVELSEQQKQELAEYRKAWLEATETNHIPKRLEWFK